ncbi:Protein of unknown function [Bacillus cereus]|nr:Protein of unknown function [Bacillus cereus]
MKKNTSVIHGTQPAFNNCGCQKPPSPQK